MWSRGRLQHFLHQSQLHSLGLYHSAHSSGLLCSSLAGPKKSLERLLANGLRVRRQQAELALSLSADNHLQIRDAISALNGWQTLFQRLDKEGVARSTEIQRLQARLCYRVASGWNFPPCNAGLARFAPRTPCRTSSPAVISFGKACNKP